MTPEQLQNYYYKSLSIENLKKEPGIEIKEDIRSNRIVMSFVLLVTLGLFFILMVNIFVWPMAKWLLYFPTIGLACYFALGRKFGWCDVTDAKRKFQKMDYYDYKDIRLVEHLKDEEYVVDDIALTKSRMKELAELCSDQYTYQKPQQNFILLGIFFSILFAIVSPSIGFGLECVKLYAIQEQKPLDSYFPYIFIYLALVLFFLFVIANVISSVYIQYAKNKYDKAKQFLFLSIRINRILHELQFEKIEKKTTRRRVRKPRTKADTKPTL